MKKRTKNLIKIGGLAAVLALIGGTFAFTSFGQRALNITEGTNRPEYGGRVHDYFDDESGNKDVFSENFGTSQLFTRVKLTELFTKNGVSIVDEPTIDVNDPETWPTWIPGPSGIAGSEAAGTRIGINEPINQYFHLSLGQSTHGDDRPWFLPTFNLDPLSMMTAAAGAGFDMEHEGVTHPGDGTANYWGAGDTSFALPVAGDSAEEHAVQQVLDQERPPLTYAQWLNAGTPVGNFWVIDQDTGWAYWANFLAGGAATSFLVDSKLPQDALADIEGDWSYQLHVIGQFASEGDISEFWESDDAAGLSTEHGERVIEEILDAQTPAP
ncbi:hypothetical protein NG812_01295 [Lactococcus garvieae]|jgi:hypothetical protein|uniref:Uncharacterized protein n=2 Tax=Lactococcus TaxID=1357 RepID=A0AA46TW07_9LACT|nr:hypothetical protein [Lactococcus garvieae]KAA8718750.1 hypothetical protein F4V47_01115 [Lactococcus garvieae subsp. garvieae]MDG6191214.1 hypothetical protein [Lactococcus garvieae]NHI68785.1 hypothetical protein [Lactococcus garvieae]NHJ06946.1 hypothetical protein [Lactococcus garvieae]PCS02619.1 hypothetical protein RU85_GL001696 [Lactococcus garvieae]